MNLFGCSEKVARGNSQHLGNLNYACFRYLVLTSGLDLTQKRR